MITLFAHISEAHSGEFFQECFFCPVEAFSDGDLMVHILSHISRRIFVCEGCNEFYVRIDHIEDHSWNEHDGKARFIEIERNGPLDVSAYVMHQRPRDKFVDRF